MELTDEYVSRHKCNDTLVRYHEKSQLLLLSRLQNSQYKWLHVNINLKQDPNKPPCFHFLVSANPTLFATPDFSHATYHYELCLVDSNWQWEDFDENIREWAKSINKEYSAVSVSETMPLCWKIFVLSNDRWLSSFLPIRMIDDFHASLFSFEKEIVSNSILNLEEWLRNKHERVFLSWQAVKKNIDVSSYANWLAEIVGK